MLQNKRNTIALNGLAEVFLELPEEEILILLKNYLENRIGLEEFSEKDKWKKWMCLYHQLSVDLENIEFQEIMQQLLDFFLPVSVLSDQQQMKRDMLLKLAMEFNDNTGNFLQKYILSPYTDTGRLNSGGVRLMTFHAVKGLEFPVVFIAGAEEGIAPLTRKDIDMEEERRLFYVALTRAKDELQVTRSKKRKIYGSEQEMLPSRFINECGPNYFQNTEFETLNRVQPVEKQLKLF